MMNMTPKSVTRLGLALNIVLSIGKLLAGIFCGSLAILVDGIHSATDMVTDVVVLVGLRISEAPPDENHHYGHGRVSTLVAMFIGASLLGVGIMISYRAVVSLHEPHSMVRPTIPFWIALASVPAKELLYRLTAKVAEKTGNLSLAANAWHHRTDALTSIAAAAGLAGVALGGPSWAFLDHVTALVLAAFLFSAAIGIVKDAAGELIDKAPKTDVLNQINEIASTTDGVRDYHAVRARMHGGQIDMDIHILVDSELTVLEGHDIARNVRKRICQSEHGVRDVIVHVEPFDCGS